MDDFRAITISPVISKSRILDCYSITLQCFVTTNIQFGFKTGLSCLYAIYSVKCLVDHCNQLGSTINQYLLYYEENV